MGAGAAPDVLMRFMSPKTVSGDSQFALSPSTNN